MRWPIRLQLLLGILFVVIFGITATTAVSAYLAVRVATRQQAQNFHRVVRTLTEATYPLSRAVLDHMSGLSGGQFVVLDRRQQVLHSTIRVDADALARLASARPRPPANLFSEANVIRLNDRAYFSDAIPLEGKARNTTSSRLVVLYPKDRWWSIARRVASPILMAGMVTTLAAVLVSVMVAGRLVRPIRLLRNQADSIAAGEFRPVDVPRRNDEIGDLTLAINSMTEKLSRFESEVRRSERMRTLGQLGAGIAHQLRNSATGARMAIELYQREEPTSADAESLAMALRQLQLMESHLQRFLDMGRREAGSNEPVVLQSVVDEVSGLVRPACSHAGIELAVACPEESVVVEGDSQALGQLLMNLVCNGIEAAERAVDSGGRVSIDLRTAGERAAVLQVRDSGPGPDAAVSGKLFEPFVTDKPDGTGLGLYVAHRVVEAHRGSIRWQRHDDMTCFTVELPIAGSSHHGPLADR